MESKESVFNIKIITSVKDIEDIREFWEETQYHPFTIIDFYLTIINVRSAITKPYILVIMQFNKPVAIAVCRIDKTDFKFRIGYLTFYKKSVKQLSVLCRGFLGNLSNEMYEFLIQEFQKQLKTKEYDIVYFENLIFDSVLFKTITNIFPSHNKNKVIPTSKHYTLNLPENIESFYKTKKPKHRYWLKRIGRVLEEEYSGKIEYKIYTKFDDIDQLCNDAEKIAMNTYHRGIGAGFIDNEEYRSRIALLAEKGWLRVYIMYIDEKPSAFWIGTLYKNIFYLDFTGYLEEYSKFEIGTVLFLKMIDDLCNLKVKTMDYGFGDALYKQRFSDQQWDEGDVYIYPSSLTGLFLKILKDVETFVTGFLKSIFYKINIKKIWRNRIKQK